MIRWTQTGCLHKGLQSTRFLLQSCVRCQWFQSNNTESLFAGDSEHLEIWAEHPKFKGFNLVNDKIAVITVEPADKISFVYNCMQTRLRGQYNGKWPISFVCVSRPLVTVITAIKPVISTTWPWKNKTVIYLTQVSVDLAAQYHSTHWGKCKSTRTQTKIWFSVRSENQET